MIFVNHYSSQQNRSINQIYVGTNFPKSRSINHLNTWLMILDVINHDCYVNLNTVKLIDRFFLLSK